MHKSTEIISYRNAKIILFCFCVLHIIFWTLGSQLCRPTLTHDVLEGIAWGNQWQLGYHKHPFVAAWLVALATKLGGVVGWPVYLLSQLAVVTLFVAVFNLAKKIVPVAYALISVFLLEGIIYYNINSINFTPDTAQSPFWGLCALFFFNALIYRNCLSWFLTAIFAGLCFLTKYQAIFLFAPMFFILVFTTEGRKSFKNKWFYFALIIFTLLICPHLIWAYKQKFSGIDYMHSSWIGEKHSFFNHFYFPYRYLRGQMLVVLGAVILTWPFWKNIFKFKNKAALPPQNASDLLSKSVSDLSSKKVSDLSSKSVSDLSSRNLRSKYPGSRSPSSLNNNIINYSKFAKIYILLMGLTPLLLTVMYSALTGKHILQRWSTPYYYLLGLVFVVLIKPILTKENFSKFIKSTFVALFVICCARNSYYYWGPKVTKDSQSDVYLPNKQIAKKLTEIWHDNYGNVPLKYVAAPHYLCAFISVYSKDKPIPYMSFSKLESPWVDEKDLDLNGGIIALEVDQHFLQANKSNKSNKANKANKVNKTNNVKTNNKVKNYDHTNENDLALPKWLIARFPRVKNMGVYKFKKEIVKNNETVDILVGLLPPK